MYATFSKIKRPLLILSLVVVAAGAASAYDACNPCKPRRVVKRVRSCPPRRPVCAPVACPTPIVAQPAPVYVAPAPAPAVCGDPCMSAPIVTTAPAPVVSVASCGEPCSSTNSVTSSYSTPAVMTNEPVTVYPTAPTMVTSTQSTGSTATVAPAASRFGGSSISTASYETGATERAVANWASNDSPSNWERHLPPQTSDTPSNYDDSLTNIQAMEGEIPAIPGLNY